MTKSALRRDMAQKLRDMSPEAKAAASWSILQRLLQRADFATASRILVYAALPSEPDLLPLFTHLSRSQRLVFPLVASDRLTLHEVKKPEHLIQTGRLRQPDPAHCKEISPSQINLALIPGVAFTAAGNRLGRGGGYYDRLLADPRFTAHTVGIAFACQIAADVPIEPHDLPVREVLTESGYATCVSPPGG